LYFISSGYTDDLLMTASSAPPVLDRLSSLADETRARILLLLEGSEMTVSELCQVLQLPQSTVSRNLSILAREGWLSVRSEGTSRHYRLARELDESAGRLWAAVREDFADSDAVRSDRARARSVMETRAERSRAFFSAEAGRWDSLREELFGRRAELQLLPGLLEGTETVGDLGCGTGQLARLLAPFAGRVVGVDRSAEMLELARERLARASNVELRQGELEALPLDDGALDVAILSLVLHYVADPARVFVEARRVLRPGGRLLILEMQRHQRAAFREEMGHLWLGFSTDEIEQWLVDAGFRDIRVAEPPADPEASGPLLMSARARRPAADGAPPMSREPARPGQPHRPTQKA
jgi:SAM-dependent methyltransferase